jgi:ankyrin repeat protein
MSRTNRTILATMLAIALLVSADTPHSRRQPPLHWAASRGYAAMVEILLRNGADIEQRDAIGRTPLHRAARHPEVVRVLLENGADATAVDAFDNTALHLGVRFRPVAEQLIAAGADVNALNHVQRTPLHYAIINGESRYNLGIIELLIESGAR